MTKLAIVLGMAFVLPGMASAREFRTDVPPNTIDCKDFSRLPNGMWSAHANAKPFNIAKSKGMSIQSSTFGRHGVVIDDYDLAMVLDQKCGR